MSILFKLILRELLVFALPVSALVIYVYHNSDYQTGSLVFYTKVISWTAILGFHYLMHPNRIYTIRSAGYPLRRVLLYAGTLDFLFMITLLSFLYAVS